ncbi:hypothetical protein Tco_1244311 [Tanacetum coccineum]
MNDAENGGMRDRSGGRREHEAGEVRAYRRGRRPGRSGRQQASHGGGLKSAEERRNPPGAAGNSRDSGGKTTVGVNERKGGRREIVRAADVCKDAEKKERQGLKRRVSEPEVGAAARREQIRTGEKSESRADAGRMQARSTVASPAKGKENRRGRAAAAEGEGGRGVGRTGRGRREAAVDSDSDATTRRDKRGGQTRDGAKRRTRNAAARRRKEREPRQGRPREAEQRRGERTGTGTIKSAPYK